MVNDLWYQTPHISGCCGCPRHKTIINFWLLRWQLSAVAPALKPVLLQWCYWWCYCVNLPLLCQKTQFYFPSHFLATISSLAHANCYWYVLHRESYNLVKEWTRKSNSCPIKNTSFMTQNYVVFMWREWYEVHGGYVMTCGAIWRITKSRQVNADQVKLGSLDY